MSNNTKIEWVVELARALGMDARVWNPLRGCLPASPGCSNCWAAPVAAMRSKNPNPKISGRHADLTIPNGKAFNGTCRATDEWNIPVRISRPSVFFVCSESDLFFEGHDDEAVDKVFDIIAAAPWHLFLILTKRAERLPQFFSRPSFGREVAVFDWPLPNVWLGVSVEDQQRADERIPHLLATPATKRFLSCEPLLGRLDLNAIPLASGLFGRKPSNCLQSVGGGAGMGGGGDIRPGVDWVIVGGESGQGARPMHPDWARLLRDQCATASRAFFFKQWGEWQTVYDRDREDPDWRRCPAARDNRERYVNLAGGHGFHGDRVVFARRVGKKAAGFTLDGVQHRELPILPIPAPPGAERPWEM